MGSSASVVAEIVTDVKDRLPELPPPSQIDDPDSARFRLFDSITSFLKTASQSQPLVIVLDDLHWSDRPTLTFLEFIARELNQSRVLLVCTYRDVELNRRHQLTVTLGDLARDRLYERVLLRGLTEHDIARFVEIAAGFAVPRELSATVHRHTEGNPLFVTEVIRDLVQSDELTEEKIAGRSSWSVRIPEGVREVIGRRLDRMSDRANEVFTTAAVVGRQFSLDALRALHGPSLSPLVPAGEDWGEREGVRNVGVATGATAPSPSSSRAGRGGIADPISDGQLLDVLDEALDAKLVEELPGEVGHYQFTHALVQETLTSELSAARRVRLHARIAETLERIYGDAADDHAAELMPHFDEAEPILGPDRLVHYATVAGEAALTSHAHEAAESLFSRALEAIGPGPVGEPSAAALSGLGRAQLHTNYGPLLQQAVGNLVKAFDFYAEAGNVETAAFIASQHVWTRPGAMAGMEPIISQALEMVPPDSLTAGLLLSTRGHVEGYDLDEVDASDRSFDRALGIARALAASDLELRVLVDRAEVALERGRYVLCREILQEAEPLASQDKDIFREFSFLTISARLASMEGDLSEAEAQLARCRALAQRLGPRSLMMANLLADEQTLAWIRGDIPRAAGIAAHGASLFPTSSRFLTMQILAAYELGDFAAGSELVEQSSRREHGLTGGYYDVVAAVHLNHAGRVARSNKLLESALHFARKAVSSHGQTAPYRDAAKMVAMICASALGDVDAARSGYEAVGDAEMAHVPWYYLMRPERALAHAASAFGDFDRAAAHFAQALSYARGIPHLPELAWTCSDYAEMLLDRAAAASTADSDGASRASAHVDSGDREKAIELQDEALAITRELGMRPLTERILARREILRA